VTAIYLDHAASTPMRPAARAALVDVLDRLPGNPSGQHRWARDARRRLDDARDQIAAALGCRPSEIVVTSGGTEADNLAIAGAAGARVGPPVCVATDHHAAIEPVRALGGVVLSVDGRARIDPEAFAARLAGVPSPSVVSLCLANNELGVVQPAAALIEVVRRASPGTLVHLDAVAAASWLDLRPLVEAADLVSISGHKVGGPKGSGVLVVRDGVGLAPLLHGGAQERERRAGTPDVAGAAATAVALAEAVAEREELVTRIGGLRDRLAAGILAMAGDAAVDTVALVDGAVPRVANVAHLSCRGVHREALLFRLDELGIAASAGSSCASGALEASHVVAALDLPDDLRAGPLRLSLGWSTTADEVEQAIPLVAGAIVGLRAAATEPPARRAEEGVPR
jgi:cysteine desulfurase